MKGGHAGEPALGGVPCVLRGGSEVKVSFYREWFLPEQITSIQIQRPTLLKVLPMAME